MAVVVRQQFHRALVEIDERTKVMFAVVADGIAGATESLLAVDETAADAVIEREALLDDIARELEQTVERVVLTQSPMASEYRHLVTVLRITPELERSGDLVEHIAQRARRGVARDLPPDARGTIQRLGDEVAAQWRRARQAFVDRDPSALGTLERCDDKVDKLARQLWSTTANAPIVPELKMELALVARFYERLGDHACHITARLTPTRLV